MHARSTTIHGAPHTIDAAVAFARNEAAPLLETIDGSLGMSVLIDRETGECITTSSWQTVEAMNASRAQLRTLRERGRDILGGSMQIDEWAIAVMHHRSHGDCARVSWLHGGDQDAMTTTFRLGILPRLGQTDGFCGASLLLDREAEIACATTVWESRAKLEASRPAADTMRQQAAGDSGATIADVHEFDLAFAHLHVPEMV